MEAQVARWCGEILEQSDFKDCILVDVVVSGRKKIAVYLDSDTGITFQTCQQISRILEGKIEASNLFDEKYVLEVSSPGAKRPMKHLRQYPKHIGRTLEILLKDGSRQKGTLQSVTDGSITIDMLQKKKGKKKKQTGSVTIPFDQIEHAIVAFPF